MTNYFRVMLGRRSACTSKCLARGFIEVVFGIQEDLSGNFPDLCDFSKPVIPA